MLGKLLKDVKSMKLTAVTAVGKTTHPSLMPCAAKVPGGTTPATRMAVASRIDTVPMTSYDIL